MMDPELNKFYQNWSRKIESILQSQAPVKTGSKLKNSVIVKFEPDINNLGGKFVITTSAENNGFKYGLAFQYGTLDFYTRNTKGKNPIEPDSVKKSRSKKGIPPIYWMNLKDIVLENFTDELAQEIKRFSAILIRNEISKEIPKQIGNA